MYIHYEIPNLLQLGYAGDVRFVSRGVLNFHQMSSDMQLTAQPFIEHVARQKPATEQPRLNNKDYVISKDWLCPRW